jgi:diguanylate cyclase (GGDEF)-like protein
VHYIKIVIADDHEPSRRIIRRFLEPLDQITIVGEAGSGEELIRAVADNEPNLVLVDINMPKMNGIQAIKECLSLNPGLKVIFITGHNEYAVEAFDVSAVDYIVKPIEKHRLEVAIEKAKTIIMMNFELNEALHQKEYMASHDVLSGLPNRKHFEDKLTSALVLAKKSNYMVALLFLDLDRFKTINESMGHAVGDLLLQQVAERLQRCVRDKDIISRQGGDEFTILLNRISHRNDVVKAVERLFHSVKQPFHINGHEINAAVSMGIALYPNDGETGDNLIKQAETAMYQAKQIGRNNYAFYTPEMDEKISKQLRIESALRKAIERDELLLYYQPQVNIENLQIVGMEALIRWDHPEWGLISPIDFIPLAEETGLILPIGEWVLRTACRQAKTWQNVGYPRLKLSVNLSLLQFQQENLVQVVTDIVEETNFDPSLLELEITESIALDNEQQVIDKLNELRKLNIKIAIDDFGTGYSSLSYLKKFPINTLKIDKVFVREIMSDSEGESLIAAIISMAQTLKFNVIAEGVESEAQLSFLHDLKCNEAQGYLFGKPLPEEQFLALLNEYSAQTDNLVPGVRIT